MKPPSAPAALLAAILLGALGGCRSQAPAPELVTEAGREKVEGSAAEVVKARGGAALQATFEGKVRLLGAKVPEALEPGRASEIVLFWHVLAPLSSADIEGLKVFVHGQAPFAELNQAQADHALLGGKVALSSLRAGDLLEDRFSFAVPRWYPADEVTVTAGLYQGKKRWNVDEGDAHDSQHRVVVARLPVKGGPPSLPTAKARRVRGKITVDGVLDEPDWERAERLGPFVSYDGRRPIRNQTFARVLWDDEHLYVAFECVDPDIHTPYEKRDDPLYESEVVEVFLDADGDEDEYVELQAAPNDVQFDAAFRGGRRKNFDTSYDVPFEAKATLRGTLNDPSDTDEGWISEWRIPIAKLRDTKPPQAGDRWRVNLFRLDRLRRGERVVGSEASAWSSPLSGDFHNLKRFGTLVFTEE